MTMNPKTLGIGVIEWKVYGCSEFVDRSALKNAIATAKASTRTLFVEGSKYLLDLAIAKAQAVLSDTAAHAGAGRCRSGGAECGHCRPRKCGRQRLAYSAAVTTSFCSSWESLSAVNDGIVRSTPHNPSKPRFAWGNTSSL